MLSTGWEEVNGGSCWEGSEGHSEWEKTGFLLGAGSMPHFSELGQQDEDFAVEIFLSPACSTQSRHDQIKTNLSS